MKIPSTHRYAANGLRLLAFTAVSCTLMAASCGKKKGHCEAYGKTSSISNPHLKMKNGQAATTASAAEYKANIPQ